jgi:two-component system sensor histidine kinase PilS (NtrC family)
MTDSMKDSQVFYVERNIWFLLGRLAMTLMICGSGVMFLKPSSFSYALLTLYGVSGTIYFVYHFSGRAHSRAFIREIVIANLIFELLVESLLVNHVGGSFSPFILFFILTIAVGAVYFRLPGSIIVATSAGLLYSMPVFFDLSFVYQELIEPPRLAGMGISSDEAFYTVFLHLCLFYFSSFISGYLVQRLFVTTRELSRLRFETGEILEQMRSGLLTVNSEMRIVHFNKAAGEILGVAAADARGKLISEVFDRNLREFERRIWAAIDQNRGEDRCELEIHHPERGGDVPIGLSLSIIRDEGDNIRGVIAVFQDLTEAKKLEERMRATDRMAAVGRLAAGIAHEIRNPLASISGSVEVLKDELKPHGENLGLMQLILKESSRLNTILTDFLNFARISRRRNDSCDLGVVIADVVRLAASNSEVGDSVDISYRLHRPVIMVSGGEDEIKQILWNLVLNSSQALEGTGGRIVITTEDFTVDEKAEMIKLVVSDSGPGVPEAMKEKIFDPFFSTRRDGTGLGLPIVMRLADSLGGRAELESSGNEGTRFAVYLPRRRFEEKKSEVFQEVTIN